MLIKFTEKNIKFQVLAMIFCKGYFSSLLQIAISIHIYEYTYIYIFTPPTLFQSICNIVISGSTLVCSSDVQPIRLCRNSAVANLQGHSCIVSFLKLCRTWIFICNPLRYTVQRGQVACIYFSGAFIVKKGPLHVSQLMYLYRAWMLDWKYNYKGILSGNHSAKDSSHNVIVTLFTLVRT